MQFVTSVIGRKLPRDGTALLIALEFQFVVVGANGAILTSPDGHTWTAQNSGASDPFVPGATMALGSACIWPCTRRRAVCDSWRRWYHSDFTLTLS